MKYVVRSEVTEGLGASEVFDTLEEAREQLNIWLEDDAEDEDGDWADIIVAVPDKDAKECAYGYAETEKFVEGKCGRKFHGSYYWKCE